MTAPPPPGYNQPFHPPTPAPTKPTSKSRLPWIIGGVVALVLILCGGLVALVAITPSADDEPDQATPVAPSFTPAVNEDTPEGLIAAIYAESGLECGSLARETAPEGTTGQARCQARGGEVVIRHYATQADADAHFAKYAALVTQVGDANMATGDRWTISGGDVDYIREAASALEGRFQTQPRATQSAAPAEPAPAPVAEITDGIWTVGEDVPAGTYKVTAPVQGLCYWSITRSGSNGSDIIENDLPSGGLPRVTIKKGQDFETSGCGVWRKQ